jgi:hypothetical protein
MAAGAAGDGGLPAVSLFDLSTVSSSRPAACDDAGAPPQSRLAVAPPRRRLGIARPRLDGGKHRVKLRSVGANLMVATLAAEAGTTYRRPQGAQRARHLAGAVLGAHDPQRGRRRPARRILLFNPVKHGLVTRVRDWPYSSFRRDVGRGIFPIDWAGDVAAAGEFGEASEAGQPKA